jgi:hypothetical protein
MSTRATYQFNGGHTVYIHHDGYPTGAAVYFYNMLTHPNERGGFATRFIRANDGAELTGSHDSHGDTDYRYTLYGDGVDSMITVYGFRGDGDGDGEYRAYSRELHKFIEEHSENIENFKPFKLVDLDYVTTWLNEVTAKRLLGDAYRTETIWKQNGHTRGANWDALQKRINNIRAAFPELNK